ncbi:MAG: response regulator [Agitococcus sp.]|jgi:two-component system KDP operon response regulator KdpE|nr:response regulator [Agitococcus sp.]
MTSKQVLLVEDDEHLRVMLLTALTEYGYQVTATKTASAAFQIVRESELDVILLDLGLPDFDGNQLIPMLKGVSDTPIIIISARDKEVQKIAALDAGADDYLTKPFGVGELLARMRSALRRSLQIAQPIRSGRYLCRDLEIDIHKHQVLLAGELVHVTPVEFRLLEVLVRYTGKVMTHRQLLREVWGPNHEEDGHYLRIYMRQLRRKLEVNPAEPQYLLTEPGVGYRLAFE